MNFKDVLIVTDLDGTLLDDEKNIAEEDMKAINDFRSKGGLFAAATGRGAVMARRIIDRLDIRTPCVIFNGAAIYDFKADKFLWHSDMPEISDRYIRMLEKEFPDIGVEILYEKDIYVTHNNQTVQEHLALEQLSATYCGLDDVPETGRIKVLIAYPPEKIQAVIDFTQENCKEGVNWVHSSPMYYEMLPEGISKASGVKKLVGILSFQDKFVAAAGDYGNDRTMIAEADLGVAVGNALDSVKEAADLIVRDNNHAPISEMIEYIKKLPARRYPDFHKGDVILTRPEPGYYGIAVVLDEPQSVDGSLPLCHIAVTPLIFTEEPTLADIDISQLKPLVWQTYFSKDGRDIPLRVVTAVHIYQGKNTTGLRVIGNIDTSGIYTGELSWKPQEDRFHLCGKAGARLGREAYIDYCSKTGIKTENIRKM